MAFLSSRYGRRGLLRRYRQSMRPRRVARVLMRVTLVDSLTHAGREFGVLRFDVSPLHLLSIVPIDLDPASTPCLN